MDRLGDPLKEAKSAISGAGPSTGPMLRSASPALVPPEHAAWVTAVELVRATARAAAAIAVPARKGRRAGQPVHPRQISFTAARRAVIASIRSGAATASLPAGLTRANRDARWPAWPAAASLSTVTGTATGRPRPARASRMAGHACRSSPPPPRSASAHRSPPDRSLSRTSAAAPAAMEPAARRSDSRPIGTPLLCVNNQDRRPSPERHDARHGDHVEVNGIELIRPGRQAKRA